MESYLGEGDGLINFAVSVDGEMGGDASLAHGVDRRFCGGPTGKVDDEGAADGKGAVAGELDFFGGVEPVGWGDEHGVRRVGINVSPKITARAAC